VINTNLHPISHRFQVIADNWSNLCLWQGVPIFNTVVWGDPGTQDHEICLSPN